jgi:hypothetical protein
MSEHTQPPTLIIGQLDATTAQLCFQGSVLFAEEVNDSTLLSLDPSKVRHKQKVEWGVSRSELHTNTELKLPFPDDVIARGPDGLERWIKGQRRNRRRPADRVHPSVQLGNLCAVEKVECFSKNLQVRLVRHPKPPRDPQIHINDLWQPKGVACE